MSEVVKPQSEGLAIAGMVLGICSIVLSLLLGGVLGILALIFSIIALRRKQSKAFALTGIITGAIGILIGLLFLGLFIFGVFLGIQESEQNSNVEADASTVYTYVESYREENDVYPNFEQIAAITSEIGIPIVKEGDEVSDLDISYTPCYGEGGIVWYWSTEEEGYLSFEAGNTSVCEN